MKNTPNGVSLRNHHALMWYWYIQYQSDNWQQRKFSFQFTVSYSAVDHNHKTNLSIRRKRPTAITCYNYTWIVNINEKSCLMKYGKAQRGRSIKPNYYWIQMPPPLPPTPPRLTGTRWQWRMIQKLNLNNSQIDSKNCRNFAHNWRINNALLVL